MCKSGIKNGSTTLRMRHIGQPVVVAFTRCMKKYGAHSHAGTDSDYYDVRPVYLHGVLGFIGYESSYERVSERVAPRGCLYPDTADHN